MSYDGSGCGRGADARWRRRPIPAAQLPLELVWVRQATGPAGIVTVAASLESTVGVAPVLVREPTTVYVWPKRSADGVLPIGPANIVSEPLG